MPVKNPIPAKIVRENKVLVSKVLRVLTLFNLSNVECRTDIDQNTNLKSPSN